MYETMLYWETAHTVPGARTRIERNFDRGMVRQLKSATEHDMTVGGADLARAGHQGRAGRRAAPRCKWERIASIAAWISDSRWRSR